MIYIGIIGTRRRNEPEDYVVVRDALIKLLNEVTEMEQFVIVSGGCPRGGDLFAKLLAQQHNSGYLEFPADWKRIGKGAGFHRNTFIASESDYLIACVAEDRTGGTEDTIKKFLKENPEDRLILV